MKKKSMKTKKSSKAHAKKLSTSDLKKKRGGISMATSISAFSSSDEERTNGPSQKDYP